MKASQRQTLAQNRIKIHRQTGKRKTGGAVSDRSTYQDAAEAAEDHFSPPAPLINQGPGADSAIGDLPGSGVGGVERGPAAAAAVGAR